MQPFPWGSLPPQQEAKSFEHMLEMPMTEDVKANRPSDGGAGVGGQG
jgi:hypothetical protein